MNDHRKLLVALGGGTRAVPLVLKKSGGYAPKKDRVVCAFTLLVVVWAALTMTTAIAADLEATGIVKTSRGEVTVNHAGQQNPAPVGTPVFVGDRVHTTQARAATWESRCVTIRFSPVAQRAHC